MRESILLQGFDWDADVSDEERDRLFESIAAVVHKWRLELPCLLWLETTAPLSHLLGQGAIAVSPMVIPAFPGGAEGMQRFVKLMSEPANVRLLMSRIESGA